MIMTRLTPASAGDHGQSASLASGITEISFCAWIAQAEAGEALIYHQGYLAVDTDPVISKLPVDQRLALRALASAAFRAGAQGLVHLVQQRLGTDRFAYVAIARPKPKSPRPAFAARLLEAA
jgi:hypothetical protein